MRLFNASSLFNEETEREILGIVGDADRLREKLIGVKKSLLRAYNFTAHCVPDDFTEQSYVIAANHLTDSDAPLIMSFYYDTMHDAVEYYPQLFVFAKENCFNGVSIPKELTPILEMEKVIAVDRESAGGAMGAMRAAKKMVWGRIKAKTFFDIRSRYNI